MTEVVPAIIAKNFKDLQTKIEKVSPYVDWIQLDIMDGQFVEGVTWYKAEELSQLQLKKIKLEAHLMVFRPEETIDQWIEAGLERIVFHYEATHRREDLINKIKEAGLQVGLAIDIETPVSFISTYLKYLDSVLVMSVKAGKGGQVFRPEALKKIKALRQAYPVGLDIGIDGGINLETGRLAVEAGANILNCGSYILESNNIEKAIGALKEIKVKRE